MKTSLTFYCLKKIDVLSIFCIIASLLAQSCKPAEAPPDGVNLESTINEVTVGDVVSCSVTARNILVTQDLAIAAVDLDIVFDPLLIEYVGANTVDSTSNIDQLAHPEPGTWPPQTAAEVEDGVLDFASVSGNSAEVLEANQLDTFEIVRLTFRAKSSGIASLSINLNDPNLILLDSRSQPADILGTQTSVQFRIL